jgi:hypothetical protein
MGFIHAKKNAHVTTKEDLQVKEVNTPPLTKKTLQVKEVNICETNCFDVESLAFLNVDKTYNQFHGLLQYSCYVSKL